MPEKAALDSTSLALLNRLGISEDMKPKLKPYEAGDAVEAVAKGEAEIVVNGTVPILSVPGVGTSWLVAG